MERLDITAARALRTALDTQPVTDAKITFAWTIAAGAAVARAAAVSWSDGVLRVQPKSEEWRYEIVRAKRVIQSRMDGLLGAGVIRRLVVLDAPSRT